MKTITFTLIALFSALVCGCSERKTFTVSEETKVQFRDGDLLFRCGSGMESKAVTSASGAVYSHVGILLFDSVKGEWMVVHAVPGESPKGEPDKLKVESLAEFFDASRAECGAWARVECDDETARSASRYAKMKADEGIEFDDDYQLADSTRLYCTELVWRAYLQVGVDVSEGRREAMPPFVGKEPTCIFPSTIAESGKMRSVEVLF